jgi:hypothetical protein
MMIVNNSVPVRTIPELIAYAKKNPGKLAFGSDGNGTTAHLGVELFKAMTGVNMLHVPYRAATSAVTDLIGGGIQLMMINTPVSAPMAQAGKVRALGISSAQRLAAYPDVPTIAESVPGFEVSAWGGIVGPAHLGICCQKVGEAAVFVEAGIGDILVTNQVIGDTKLRHLAPLARRPALLTRCAAHDGGGAHRFDHGVYWHRRGPRCHVLVRCVQFRCTLAASTTLPHFATSFCIIAASCFDVPPSRMTP